MINCGKIADECDNRKHIDVAWPSEELKQPSILLPFLTMYITFMHSVIFTSPATFIVGQQLSDLH